MTSAERVAVPRSSTRATSAAVPSLSTGSSYPPARATASNDTAGVVWFSSAMTTMPLSRVWRTGFSGMDLPAARTIQSSGSRGKHCAGNIVDLGEVDRRQAIAQRERVAPRTDGLEIAKLVGDVGDAVHVENESGAELGLGLFELAFGDPGRNEAVELVQHGVLDRGQRSPRGHRGAHRIEKRLRGRKQRAVHRRGEAAVDEPAIQSRAALGPGHASRRPDVQAGPAAQHGIGDEQGEEGGVSERRCVIHRLPVGGRPLLAQGHPALSLLRWLEGGPASRRAVGGDGAELLLHPAQAHRRYRRRRR